MSNETNSPSSETASFLPKTDASLDVSLAAPSNSFTAIESSPDRIPICCPPAWISGPEPWPDPVLGAELLDALTQVFTRFVILPKWAPETLALWTLHTYVFERRDVTTYLGIESPLKRCGKSTLLTVLSRLVCHPIVSTNISPPALFRVIEQARPTLLIDEADRLLKRNDELRGILNSGYTRSTAYVVRTCQLPAPPASRSAELPEADIPKRASSAASVGLVRFSAWCPKALAGIGHLPDTLADRCIIIQMQRKSSKERCERLRNLQHVALKAQCARFALDYGPAISQALPDIPQDLNDRAADIWEPLFVLADLAGARWPALARQAAVNLSATTQDSSPISLLLLDLFILLAQTGNHGMFSRDLIKTLNAFTDHPWSILRRGKPVTELWLAQLLRPFGIRPHPLRIGDIQARGYRFEDFEDTFRRYISRAEFDSLKARLAAERNR